MIKSIKYIAPILLILFLACNEEKKAPSGMFDSISKSFDQALEKPEVIRSLNLSEEGIESFPEALDSRFVNLIQLTLRKNKIKEVPASIGSLSKLISLHLGGNMLTSLPSSIGDLNRMSNLTLESNQINELPDVAFRFDKTATVDLRWNKLATLPESFSKSNIAQLYLSGNPIKELPDNIGELRGLKTLWLADSEISELPDSFYDLKNLSWLDVRGTKLSKKQIEEIKEKLPNCGIQSDFEIK